MTRAPERDAVFDPEFRRDLEYWVRTDRKVALRVMELIEAVMRDLELDWLGKKPWVGKGTPSCCPRGLVARVLKPKKLRGPGFGPLLA